MKAAICLVAFLLTFAILADDSAIEKPKKIGMPPYGNARFFHPPEIPSGVNPPVVQKSLSETLLKPPTTIRSIYNNSVSPADDNIAVLPPSNGATYHSRGQVYGQLSKTFTKPRPINPFWGPGYRNNHSQATETK